MQCRAWFGPIIKTASTKELIDKDILSELKIEMISLQYPDAEKKIVKKMSYQEEIDFLVSHSRRNEFLVDLALSRPKNTLLLFSFIDKHRRRIIPIS